MGNQVGVKFDSNSCSGMSTCHENENKSSQSTQQNNLSNHVGLALHLEFEQLLVALQIETKALFPHRRLRRVHEKRPVLPAKSTQSCGCVESTCGERRRRL